MSKQVLVIHGGNVFETYEEYMSYLQNKELTLEKVTIQDWKRNLQVTLGDEYQVVASLMQTPKMRDMRSGRFGLKKLRLY